MLETFAKIILGDSRKMVEIADESIDLVVTSPPYWHIKDYGVEGQIGYGQSLHEYLKSLYAVWKECSRVLKPGARLCINIGDQFLRSVVYGRYKIAPLHSEVIVQCEKLGFDYMGAIIWQKKTTMNTSSGANVMGSYPYPPNGMIEIDYEFILIFKKPGNFAGERQIMHEAMFPEELPRRLIKMFTFVGDVVLDPFLGSGTTAKVALSLNRSAVGYEINEAFLPIIRQKLSENLNFFNAKIEFLKRAQKVEIEEADYTPNIKDAKPLLEPKLFKFGDFYRVKRVLSPDTLELNTGLVVNLLGVKILPERQKEALSLFRGIREGKGSLSEV